MGAPARRALNSLLSSAVLGLPIVASAADEFPDACNTKPFRWMEDCRALQTKNPQGLDRLRYLPLNTTGDAWLTLGGEYRLKSEHLSAPSFGLRSTPSFTATGQRFLAHADARSGDGPRFFLQLSAATDHGRKPAERSFDRSAVDLAQGFVDLPLYRSSLRLGRQELDFGGNRLVSNRDAANLRRAFDMARLELKTSRATLALFGGQPVRNRTGAFDDDQTPGERLSGVDARAFFFAAELDIFYLRRRREGAVFQEGAGREVRHTLGVRASGLAAGADYAVQGALQTGHFAENEIRAAGLAGDIGYTLREPGWKPRLGASFGIASGDQHRGDGKLGTFDVIYPNLSYFTDAPLIYPGNTWYFNPNVGFGPLPGMRVQIGVDAIWRLSKEDAVYEPPGIPLIRGNGQGSNTVAQLFYARLSWRADRRVDFVFSLVHARAGALITSNGGRNSKYGMAQLALHF